jgi:hypothetical protein
MPRYSYKNKRCYVGIIMNDGEVKEKFLFSSNSKKFPRETYEGFRNNLEEGDSLRFSINPNYDENCYDENIFHDPEYVEVD